jgi:hypothetical protein
MYQKIWKVGISFCNFDYRIPIKINTGVRAQFMWFLTRINILPLGVFNNTENIKDETAAPFDKHLLGTFCARFWEIKSE